MSKVEYLILILILLLLASGMFSYIMNQFIFSDEHMYIAAGVLMQNNQLYADFSFLQMPYLPIIYSTIYKLTGTSYYLLTGRIVSFIAIFAASVLIFFTSLKMTKNFIISLCVLLFFSMNDILIWTMGFSWNAVLPITFSLLGVYIYLSGKENDAIKPIYFFITGVALALATGLKLYYIIIIIPFLVDALICPQVPSFKKRIKQIMIPLVAGFCIGLIPVLYYITNNLDVFLLNNIIYHQLKTELEMQTSHLIGLRALTPLTKFQFGLNVLGMYTNLALFIGVLTLFLLLLHNYLVKNLSRNDIFDNGLFLTALLAVCTISAVFYPAPMWEHYFALPIPFIIILFPSMFRCVPKNQKILFQMLVTSLTVVILLFGGLKLFSHIDRLFAVEQWEGIQINNEFNEMKNYINDRNGHIKIATYEPIYALEAGFSIYPEFSSGSFLTAVSDLIAYEDRESYVTVSVYMIHTLFEKKPPDAILVGRERKVTEPLVLYAKENEYNEVERKFRGYTLYVRNGMSKKNK